MNAVVAFLNKLIERAGYSRSVTVSSEELAALARIALAAQLEWNVLDPDTGETVIVSGKSFRRLQRANAELSWVVDQQSRT